MSKTYKQIEASRNTRLWITEVAIPVVTAGAVILGNPENRRQLALVGNKVKRNVNNKVEDIKTKFNKKTTE